VDRGVATLHQKAKAVEVQLEGGGLRRLGKSEAFRFFRRLINYDEATLAASSLNYDTHLDYFVADSAVECHRDRLIVGHQAVKVLSMKEPPSQTFAHMLGDLFAIPGEFITCLEWQRSPNDRVRRDIQSRRRHYFNKRVSLVNYVSSETRPEEMLGVFLLLGNRQGEWSSGDSAVARIAIDLAGRGVESRRSEEPIRHLARPAELTGLRTHSL